MVVETRGVLVLMAVLSGGVCTSQTVLAQSATQGAAVRGMFGDHTIGHSFSPTPSAMFAGGNHTGQDGSLHYSQPAGRKVDMTMPWQPNESRNGVSNLGAPPSLNAAVSVQSLAPQSNFGELQIMPLLVAPSLPEMTGPEGATLADVALRLTRSTEPIDVRPRQHFVRSPDLSNRLTQLARGKGMLSGPGIDVYLSSDVALLQGAVGTPSDCLLLRNVLALEPEIRQIDNRLVAIGTSPASAEIPAGNGLSGNQQPMMVGAGTSRAAGMPDDPKANATVTFSGGPITVSNPSTSRATVNYSLDGKAYTMPPGYSQEFREDRSWVISFARGANRESKQYQLQSGLYTFTNTDHGADLLRNRPAVLESRP